MSNPFKEPRPNMGVSPALRGVERGKGNASNVSKRLHNHDDLDADASAHHHTLGPGAVQASPGNHKHVIWNTGDVVYTYASADNEEWFELNGQASPTPALSDMFGSNLPTVSTGIVDLIALVHT